MKRIFFAAFALLIGLSLSGQEYWLPSQELIEKVRQEPIIKKHIEKCFARKDVFGGNITETWTIKGDELRITHVVKLRGRDMYESGQYLYVEGNASYTPDVWAAQAKDSETALMLNRSEGVYSAYRTLCDPWLTWLFYIAGYTIVDDWKFKLYKKANEVITTRPKDLADTAIKFYHLPDWSRESQIALLAKNKASRTKTSWGLQAHMASSSKYTDVKSMSAEGIEVCAGVLDAAQYDQMALDPASAVAYIYADNPLIVIAARTLEIPLLIRLYDITRLGTKTSILINPESL